MNGILLAILGPLVLLSLINIVTYIFLFPALRVLKSQDNNDSEMRSDCMSTRNNSGTNPPIKEEET